MRSTILPVVLTVAVASSVAGQQTVVITGSVRDEVTGDAVPRVSISNHDLLAVLTDEDGRFRLAAGEGTDAELILAFRRIGYAPHAETIRVAGRDSIELAVTLRPIPTVLEEIVVDGRTLTIRNPDLVGFYNRREEAIGRYLTQFEIDRAKSFDLGPYMRRLLSTGTGPCAFGAEMAVYLDGIRVPDFDMVNRIVAPLQVGGMEFYAEEDKHLLPREFITPGATCGTVLVWSRDPRGDSASLLGVHATSAWGGDNGRRTYLGVRLRFPLRDPPSSLALLFSADATSRSVTDDIWRAFLTPILRPLGLGTPWYAGAGLAITKPSNEPTVTLYPAAVSGLEARIGPLRPFVEARFFGTDRPVFTMVTGLAVAMGDGND